MSEFFFHPLIFLGVLTAAALAAFLIVALTCCALGLDCEHRRAEALEGLLWHVFRGIMTGGRAANRRMRTWEPLLAGLLLLALPACSSPAVVQVRPDGTKTLATSARLGGKGNQLIQDGDTLIVTTDDNEKSFRDAAIAIVGTALIGEAGPVLSQFFKSKQATDAAKAAAALKTTEASNAFELEKLRLLQPSTALP